MSNWNAEHFRVTLFGPASLPSPKDVLPQAFGVDVDSFAEKNFGSELIAEADWKRGRLSVRRQPGRLDFYIGPSPESAMTGPVLPDGLDLLAQLVDAVNGWVGESNLEVVRIALAGRAMLFVTDRNDGYEKFAEKVRLVTVKKNEQSDLNFQVNLPRSSQRLAGVKLNVISAWAVAFFKIFHFNGSTNSSIGEDKHFLHCVPDLSTDAERVENFSKEEISDLFGELKEIFGEVLDKGVS